MKNSSIEWTDHTFNPWIGCTKVSPGCAHCYAETLMATRYGRVEWGAGKARVRTSAANWKLPLKWDREQRRKIVSHAEFVANRRPRVFCASLADWLDYEVPTAWRVDFFALIEATPHLDWLLLTKRPESWSARLHEAMGGGSKFALAWLNGEAPANVWVGTTVEDQHRANERVPELLMIPSRVRFLSCEPLLGPVDLSDCTVGGAWRIPNTKRTGPCGQGVDWVICGGESGPGARPMHPDWARSLRDQCAAAGSAYFFKQWGEWAPDEYYSLLGSHTLVSSGNSRPAAKMTRVNKKIAGRFLDGREHNEFPTA